MADDPKPRTWSKTPSAAVFDPRVSAEAVRVLAALGHYVDFETNECWPSVGTLAGRIGVKRRVVQYHLAQLERLGYLVRLPQVRLRKRERGNAGGSYTNRYVVAFPKPPPAPAAPGEAEAAPMGPTAGEQPGSTTAHAVAIEHGAQPHCTPSPAAAPNSAAEAAHGVQSVGSHGVQPHCTQTPQRENTSERPSQRDRHRAAPPRVAAPELVEHLGKALQAKERLRRSMIAKGDRQNDLIRWLANSAGVSDAEAWQLVIERHEAAKKKSPGVDAFTLIDLVFDEIAAERDRGADGRAR